MDPIWDRMHSFNSKTLKPWLSADGWEKRGDSNLWVSIRIYLSGWCSTLFLLLICSLFGRENNHKLTHLLITKHRPVIESCKYATSPKNGSNIFPIGKSLANIIQSIIQSITTRINHDSKSRNLVYLKLGEKQTPSERKWEACHKDI